MNMKKILANVCVFAVAMVATCGVICAVASAANPNSKTGKYAYMSGVIEYSPRDKGIVAVKNTTKTKRHIAISSAVLGNTSGKVAAGNWIRKAKENAGNFSAKATIRQKADPSSKVVEILKLTVSNN